MALWRKTNRLRELRRAQKKSGQDLQLLSNISAQTIYYIERGLKRPAPYEKAMLSEALGLSESEVFPSDLVHNRKVEVAT